MKPVKMILLALTLGCSCLLAAPPPIGPRSTASIVAPPSPTTEPVLAANIFKWLDELINGARSARHVPSQAYQHTQREDRRGNGHGLLYYLALGIWRLAAGAGAAAIAGKAIEKQEVSSEAKNFAFLVPFLVGLIWPLFALFGAVIAWMVCKEGKTEPPKG